MLQDVRLSRAAARCAAPYPVPWLLALPYPARNLVRRWRGMVGMMLGVGMSLGMVMTLQGMSKASVDMYTYDFLHSGAELYVITEGGTLIPAVQGDTPGTIKHGRHVLTQVRGLPTVEAALGLVTWPMERERPGPRRRNQPVELMTAMGVDGDPLLIRDALVLREGRWLRRSDEVVIGGKLSREKALRVGDSLRLNDRDFTIVGVGKLRGAGISADSFVYMDYRAFQDRAPIGDVISIIAVETRQPDLARQRIEELESLSVFDRADLVKRAEDVHASALVIYWIFNLLALAVGALFIANMLGRAVAERRLEFATMRAIGIPTRTILLAVASEALLISLVAGVVGVGISLAFGAWINGYVAPNYDLEFLFSPDGGNYVMVLLLGLGLGVVAGLVPARQATSVDPVDVLREA